MWSSSNGWEGGDEVKQRGLANRILGTYTWAVIAFLALPILVVIPTSFNPTVQLAFPTTGLSLKWYLNLFQTPEFFRSFATSVAVTLMATLVAVVIGTIAAYALVRYRPPLARLVSTLFLAPLTFPAIVYGLAMIIFLGKLNLARTIPGLVIAHSVYVLPYIIRTVTANLYGLDRALEEAAMSLGANRLQTLKHVLFPLVKPGLIAGATFSLIMSFDEFTISLFLTGGNVVTLPIMLANKIDYRMDPTIAVVGTTLVLLSATAIVLIEKFLGFEKHFKF